MLQKQFALFILGCVLIFSSGCANTTKAYVETPDEQSAVTGKWVGTWWYGNKIEEGQPLSCVCLQIAPNQWTATFDAEYGERAMYTFDISGQQVDDIVMFKGSVDLGKENGGVYHWQGEAAGDMFNGKYQSQYNQGAFQMKKVQDSM